MFSFFTCSASIMIKAFIKAVPSMFTIAAQIVLHSVVKAMDWRNNVYVPVRKLLAIFFAIAIVTNSDSGKHWKHIFHGQVILNIGWQKMKLAVDLSVWTIYCMKHIFFLKLIFFVKPGSFSSNLRTFLSNFVATDVYALLLKSYPEDFRPILSWAEIWVTPLVYERYLTLRVYSINTSSNCFEFGEQLRSLSTTCGEGIMC